MMEFWIFIVWVAAVGGFFHAVQTVMARDAIDAGNQLTALQKGNGKNILDWGECGAIDAALVLALAVVLGCICAASAIYFGASNNDRTAVAVYGFAGVVFWATAFWLRSLALQKARVRDARDAGNKLVDAIIDKDTL